MKARGSDMEWVSASEARRILNLGRTQLEALVNNGRIASTGSKLWRADVDHFAQVKAIPHYRSGLSEVDLAAPIAFAAPLSDPQLSPMLRLSTGNALNEALAALQNKGISLGPNQFVSGWWSLSEKLMARLITEQEPILGVTGGFVVEVGYINGLAATTSYRNRHALVVTRGTNSDLRQYAGYIPKMNQTGKYVQR